MGRRPVSAPRVEIRIDRIRHNARTLVDRLAPRGISVTGVTKATLGSPAVAGALLDGGVSALGDSRVENIETLRASGLTGPMTLIRAPMPSQVERVVAAADLSFNTEVATLDLLDAAAGRQGRRHGVVLMVELGDLREGLLPQDLGAVAHHAAGLAHVDLRGIGTNLACQSGVTPDDANMAELTRVVAQVERQGRRPLSLVSGGNSASLAWACATADVGRVDDLRLGEAILLGREPLGRSPIEGLCTDAFTLVAEVIEAQVKPTRAWGTIGEGAFGPVRSGPDRGDTCRVLLALGRQDTAADDLTPPPGTTILGASSDHLVLDTGHARPQVGDEVRLGVGYAALLAAMTSPFVAIRARDEPAERANRAGRASRPRS